MSSFNVQRWKTMKFADVAEVVTGSTPSTSIRDFYDGPIPFVAPADLDQPGPIVKANSSLSLQGAQQARLVPAGSVLVCCIGATIGKVGIAGIEVATNQQINALVFNPQEVDCRYGYHYCRTLKDLIRNLGTATTLPILNKSRFSKLEIPLPPLSEQKRIADILDKADAIRRKRQEASRQFDLLTESVFMEMFPEAVSSSKTTELRNYVAELRYGTSTKSGTSGFVALRIPNIIHGIIDLADTKTVQVPEPEFEKLRLVDGDLLFVRTNGNPNYVGRCAIFDETLIRHSGFDETRIIYASYIIRARLDLDRIRPIFLQSYLQSSMGRKNLREKCRTSAGQYNINTKDIESLRIPYVDIRKQREFERKHKLIQSRLKTLADATNDTDNLLSSLLMNAFTN